jgi:mono/diheme cytochrome c family protein
MLGMGTLDSNMFSFATNHLRQNNLNYISCTSAIFRILTAAVLLALLTPTQLSAKQTEAEEKIKLDLATVNLGKRIFQQACFYCHQAGGIGKPGVAPSLVNKEFLSIASDSFLANVIRKGRGGTAMPPFNYLGDKKLKAIVAYLRSHATLPSRAKKVASQAKSKGDARLGKITFDHICLGCHGPAGSGYYAGGTGTAIGKKDFLSQASDGFIRTTIKEGRSNTRMRSFQGPAALAALTDKEIENIIAYLRTIPSK